MAFHMYRRRLPHWREEGATYFVTWCLCRGQSMLTAPERSVVAEALRQFDGSRYRMRAWVVMDDHVHCVVTQNPRCSLHLVLHSWKSFTAHRLVTLFSRPSPVWQDESYDRIVRNDRALQTMLGVELYPSIAQELFPASGSADTIFA